MQTLEQVIYRQSAHWYDKNGDARHTIIGANGVQRNTTLRDARKHGWLPSVSKILSVIAEPGLQSWKDIQLATACFTLPRKPGESYTELAKRAVEDSRQEGAKAAEWGNALDYHWLTGYLREDRITEDPEFRTHTETLARWGDENIELITQIHTPVVGDRYAGTIDMLCEHKKHGPVLLDLKTQNVKRQIRVYPKWLLQLVAYGLALSHGKFISRMPRLLNLIVDRNDPNNTFEHFYDSDEVGRAAEAWKCAHLLWEYQNNYRPDV